MRFAAALVCALAGCGRIAFEPIGGGDGGSGPGGDVQDGGSSLVAPPNVASVWRFGLGGDDLGGALTISDILLIELDAL